MDMTEYFFWRMADYFSMYLIGDPSERPVAIGEMDKEVEQSGKSATASRTPDVDDGDQTDDEDRDN